MKTLTKAQLADFLKQPTNEPQLNPVQLEKVQEFMDDTVLSSQLLGEDKDFKQNFEFVTTHTFGTGQKEGTILFLLKQYGIEAIEVFTHSATKNYFLDAIKAWIEFHLPTAVDFLLDNMGIGRYQDFFREILKQYPLFSLIKILDKNPKKGSGLNKLLLGILAKHPQWEKPLRVNIDDKRQQILDRLTNKNNELKFADVSELPHWLTRVQPWENKKAKQSMPDLVITPLDTTPVYQWRSRDELGENGSYTAMVYDEFRQFKDPQSYKYKPNLAEYFPIWGTKERALYLIGFKPARIERILQTGDFTLDDWQPTEPTYRFYGALIQLDKALALKIVSILPIKDIGHYGDNNPSKILKWLGDDFLPVMPKFLSPQLSHESYDNLVPVGWHGFAPYVAQGYCNRWQKDNAERWLQTYAKQAIHGLLPVAFDSKHKNYRHAQRALVFLLTHFVSSYRKTAEEEVAKYPKEVQEAVQFLIDNPPLDNTLDKAPTLPQNLHLPSLPPLILRQTGNAISHDYIKPLLQLFTPTKVSDPSQAVTDIKELVTEQSLATFALELYQWYEAQGRPSKYRWMFALQGHVGNDETARHLASACKRYRQELNRIGAYDALTMLSQIGTDSAIMYINSFTEQKRYGDLLNRANDALGDIAKNRGLTREELADRTVPDLGLDFSGKLILDFGARQFTVSFNEQLQPQISDDTGKKLKNLPKPNSKDDPIKASEATKRLSDLKKQLKSVASLQVKRLEMAMCNQRRWQLGDFEKFFMHHPLMRHLSQRVAWGIFDEQNQLICLCRVTEELTLTDSRDDDIDMVSLIEQGYGIGVAHRLELSDEQLAEFSQLLQDYELIQPFEQLNRQTYLYSPSETQDNDHALSEWQGRKVTVASLMGLQERGWLREVGESGMIYLFNKDIVSQGNSYTVTLQIDEGWYVWGGVDTSQVCTIEGVTLYATGFAALDKITYSELQRDLHLLAWFE